MLILARRLGEKIFIGTNAEICVTVVDIDRGKCRLGIECPREIPVDRTEVRERRLRQEAEVLAAVDESVRAADGQQ